VVEEAGPLVTDGIIAGDPANVRRNAWALWLAVQTFKDPDAYIPPNKYPMIHRAVLDACDANDGLKDGLIDEPENCNIDFKVLECKASDSPDCLTPHQVKTAQILISPATSPAGRVVFPRVEPGTELRWARLAGGPASGRYLPRSVPLRFVPGPQLGLANFRPQGRFRKGERCRQDKDIDDLDPHLAAFAKHGGKLLIYHSWADQQVAPGSRIDFYKAVLTLSPNPARASK
jgi:feruloyl esterase